MPEAIRNVLDEAVACPFCGRSVRDQVVINPTGELIGCEDCASERGLAGDVISVQEWYATAATTEALRHFDLAVTQVSKPAGNEFQQPRAHYWLVQAGSTRYYLKRFHQWYPTPSIRYIHSIMAHLNEEGIPAPRILVAKTGETFAEAAGSRWALYRAIEGRVATRQDWMWNRPKAAETLALIHQALENFTPEGREFDPWSAWTLETVDRVLENWQPHPDLSPELLGHIRDRLAVRYFGELYPELPKLTVHGDYIVSNLIWRGDSMNLSIAGVLDFERAHTDTALFDFAWGLGDRRPPLLRAAVATYSRVRPLTPVEREALPEALLLGALMAIDIEMTYYNNMAEVSRLAQELAYMVRDIESLRKAALPKA